MAEMTVERATEILAHGEWFPAADHVEASSVLVAEVERLKAERDEFPDRPSMAREIVRIQQLYQRSQDTAARLETEVERLKAERDQHREGEAALVVERDALWRRADELGREVEQLKAERDDLARALFRIRSLTMRGRGDMQVANIACDAVMHIDEGPLFPAVQDAAEKGGDDAD